LRKKFDVQSINLFPQNFGASYLKMIGYCDGSIGKPDPFVALDLDRLERLIPSQRLAIGRLRAAVRRPDPFAETDLEEVLRTAATSCRFDW
jgi:hypothetical protein